MLRVIVLLSFLMPFTAVLPSAAAVVFIEDFGDGNYDGWHRRPDQVSAFTVIGGVLRGETVASCCDNAHMLALDDHDAFLWADPWRVCVDVRMVQSFESIATMGILVSGPPEPGRALDYEMPPHTTPILEANLRNPGDGIVEIQATNITASGSGLIGVVAQAAFLWQMDTVYRLCLAREGSAIRVYVDDVLRLDYPFPPEWEPSFRITQGAIILYGYRSSAEYDNVTVDTSAGVPIRGATWGRIKFLY